MKQILLVFFMLPILSNGVYINETYRFSQGWLFLTKFAFYTKNGLLRSIFTFNNNTNALLVFATFSENDWNNFYFPNMNKNCSDMYSLLSNQPIFPVALNQYLSPTSNGTSYRYTLPLYDVAVSNVFYTFVFIFSCSGVQTFNMTGEMYFLNGSPDNIFVYHISADHFYIFESTIAFLVAYFILIFVVGFYNHALKTDKRLSLLSAILTTAIFTKFILFVSQMIVMLVYGVSGYFNVTIYLINELFNVITELFFMTLLILLSFGYTIVCGKLHPAIITGICIGESLFLIVAVVTTAINIANYSDAHLGMMYSDVPGYTLAALYFFLYVFSIWGCCIVAYQYKSRRRFYLIFGMVLTLWQLGLPILLVVSFNIRVYLRFQVLMITKNSLDLIGQLFYLILTYPKLFPKVIIYTTPAHVIQAISFEDAMRTENSESSIEVNNQTFFNIGDFQVSE